MATTVIYAISVAVVGLALFISNVLPTHAVHQHAINVRCLFHIEAKTSK